VKVIGAGFGRTGTSSLKAALEELLGAPCYHMFEVFEHPENAQTWLAGYRGEPVDWPQLLRGYAATVDWPACTFYPQLMDVYPDARVLLSVRDPERWYESTLNTIYSQPRRFREAIERGELDPNNPWLLQRWPVVGMIDEIIWKGTFGGRFTDRDHAIAVFNRHNEEVKRRVPADRLLVFDVREGWGPLCAFLDLPVPPDKPFPHLNDSASFLERMGPESAGRSAQGDS
jgi:hypothetical protein